MSVDLERMRLVLDRLWIEDRGLRVLLNVDGWCVATNGMALLAVRLDAGVGYSGKKKTVTSEIRTMLSLELGSQEQPLATLRDVAFIPADAAPCDQCRGRGAVDCAACSGYGAVGDGHRCPMCDGHGETACGCGWKMARTWTAPPALINGIGFDRGLLGEFLAPVRAERFRYGSPSYGKPWIIGGDEWRLCIMPCKLGAYDGDRRKELVSVQLPEAK